MMRTVHNVVDVKVLQPSDLHDARSELPGLAVELILESRDSVVGFLLFPLAKQLRDQLSRQIIVHENDQLRRGREIRERMIAAHQARVQVEEQVPRGPDGKPCPCCSADDEPAGGCICPEWCPNS